MIANIKKELYILLILINWRKKIERYYATFFFSLASMVAAVQWFTLITTILERKNSPNYVKKNYQQINWKDSIDIDHLMFEPRIFFLIREQAFLFWPSTNFPPMLPDTFHVIKITG